MVYLVTIQLLIFCHHRYQRLKINDSSGVSWSYLIIWADILMPNWLSVQAATGRQQTTRHMIALRLPLLRRFLQVKAGKTAN